MPFIPEGIGSRIPFLDTDYSPEYFWTPKRDSWWATYASEWNPKKDSGTVQRGLLMWLLCYNHMREIANWLNLFYIFLKTIKTKLLINTFKNQFQY